MNIADFNEELLTKQGLSFYGKITASLSHELNNTIAIINEHNGLIGDMLNVLDKGVPLDEKKLQRSSKKIGLQIERGKQLIRRLNKFAHSSDTPIAETDLAELMESIIALSQRLAGLKGMNLEFIDPSKKLAPFRTNPFYLQQAVFTVFEIFMINPEANGNVKATIEKHDDEVRIIITGSVINSNEVNQSNTDLLKILLGRLNGHVEIKSDDKSNQSFNLLLKELAPML